MKSRASRPQPDADELLARVAGRDEKALDGLYDQTAPRLRGLIQRILPDRQEAEEVLADVFLRLWKRARQLDAARVGANVWLTLTARAAAVERLRARRGAPPSDGAGTLQASLAWLPRRESTRLLDERQALLKKVMKQLPEEQFAALETAFFGGWSEAELAERLHQPLGKVRSELRASMRFLRHRLRAVLGSWVANL